MDSRTQLRFLPLVFASLAAAALVATGCSSGSNLSNITNPATETGSSFVVGTDAPMASVVSFSVPVTVYGVTSSGNVQLTSGSPTIDFARFNGLQTLIDMNDIQTGTYTGIQIVLGTATIGYLNVPASGAPTIATEPAVYPQSAATYTYSETLSTPLVVGQNSPPVGLRIDFDLHKSIGVDSNGNITGDVTPTFNISTVGNTDSGAYIDTLDAGVLTVGTQSFTVQGPHGRTFTVNVSGQTEWENGESISALTTSSIVQVSGTLDNADATIDADDVAILSQDGFYAAGQITYVTPSSGPATSFDLYVRGLLPASTGLTLGQIAQVDLTGNEKYFIYWWHNPLTEFLFNSSQLLPGQHVAIGGPATGAANADDVTVKRIVLRHWGFNGTIVPGSESSANGTFQMQITGFAGLLVPQTVTVYTAPGTKWRDGLSDMGNVTDGANIRVVGLLLKTPGSGNTVLLAHYVDALD